MALNTDKAHLELVQLRLQLDRLNQIQGELFQYESELTRYWRGQEVNHFVDVLSSLRTRCARLEARILELSGCIDLAVQDILNEEAQAEAEAQAAAAAKKARAEAAKKAAAKASAKSAVKAVKKGR